MTPFAKVPVDTLRRLALKEEAISRQDGLLVHESMTCQRRADILRDAITLDQANRAVAVTEEPVEQMPDPSVPTMTQALYWGAIGFLAGFALVTAGILAQLIVIRF